MPAVQVRAVSSPSSGLPPEVPSVNSVACGVFEGSYAVVGGGVEQVVPVDLHIKGCPPKPIDLLKGLITLMERATRKTGP